MKTVAFARVLGPAIANDAKRVKGTRTPGNEPILISTPVFDDSQVTAVQAISQRVAITHGMTPHEAHWHLLAAYRVTDLALSRNPKMHEQVLVFEKKDELESRRRLGISEDCLDPFVNNPSWYLQRCQIDRTSL